MIGGHAAHSDRLPRSLRLILCHQHYDTDLHNQAISLMENRRARLRLDCSEEAWQTDRVQDGGNVPLDEAQKLRLRNGIEILRKQRAAIMQINGGSDHAEPRSYCQGGRRKGGLCFFVIGIASCAYWASTG